MFGVVRHAMLSRAALYGTPRAGGAMSTLTGSSPFGDGHYLMGNTCGGAERWAARQGIPP